VKDQAIDAVQA